MFKMSSLIIPLKTNSIFLINPIYRFSTFLLFSQFLILKQKVYLKLTNAKIFTPKFPKVNLKLTQFYKAFLIDRNNQENF